MYLNNLAMEVKFYVPGVNIIEYFRWIISECNSCLLYFRMMYCNFMRSYVIDSQA